MTATDSSGASWPESVWVTRVRTEALAVATSGTSNLRCFLEIKTQRVMGSAFRSLELSISLGREGCGAFLY